KTHPAISRAQIQNPSFSFLEILLQQMLKQIIVAPRSDVPLFTVSCRNIFIRKIQIEIVAFAASAFRRPDALVIFHETCIMLRSLRRQGMDDSTLDPHLEST